MKKPFAFLLILMLLLSSACSEKADIIKRDTEPSTTVPVVTTEPPAPQVDVTEGITFYEEGERQNEAGDVQLCAEIAKDATLNGQYLLWMNLYQLDSESVIAVYTLSDEPPQMDGEGSTPDTVQHAVRYDFETGSVTDKVEYPKEEYLGEDHSYGFFNQTEDLLWYIRTYNGETVYTAYDSHLQVVRSFTPDGEVMDGTLSPDGAYYYSRKDFRIYAQPTDGSAAQALTISPAICVTWLDGTFTGENGETNLLFSGYAADLQLYNVCADAQTGVVRSMTNKTEVSGYSQAGLLIESNYEAGSFLATGSGCYRYSGTNGVLPTFTVISDENIVFYQTNYGENETEILLSLVDSRTGECRGATALRLPSPYAMPISYCLYDSYVVLQVSGTDTADGQGIFRWDFTKSDKTLSGVTVTQESYPMELPLLDVLCDPTELLPQPSSAALSDLRARADAMQEQYGIGLYIAEECVGVYGGYAVFPVVDYGTLSSALDTLETELTKYPDGFFRQFTESSINVYLAGVLQGVESDNLDYAGGFQTHWEGHAAIVIDCRYVGDVISTLHHEISHAIDGHLMTNDAYADDTHWNSMNPTTSCYTYSYAEFGSGDNWQYTYWNAGAENAYFIDDYSLTFEKEDRARLFENIMAGEMIDWENAPHLREKMNYFAECIRNGFDTTGWQDVYWERFS